MSLFVVMLIDLFQVLMLQVSWHSLVLTGTGGDVIMRSAHAIVATET